MLTFVVIIHIFVSLMLIAVVLLQPGNKGGVSAALGGAGGSTVFGGQGANTFLAKLTAGCAIAFMVTNFALVYFSSRDGSAFDATEWQEESAAAAAADEENKDEGDVPAKAEAVNEAPAAVPAAAPAAPASTDK
jgi:preprotein translocase subunit SecG